MDSDEVQIKDKGKLNENESKPDYKNIKSVYILKLIFNNLHIKKLLEIYRYNKYMQNKLKISIEDYKDYSKIYSQIEIEIIPEKNKYGKFININKEDEKYFHIYFNNNNEEIKRKEIDESDKIENILIKIDYQVKSFEKLFSECNIIKYINFTNFLRNNINNMSKMFQKCSSLQRD